LPFLRYSKAAEKVAWRLQHESDLQAGGGKVYLPYALARKYPRAEGE
jgi:hypothetical protein